MHPSFIKLRSILDQNITVSHDLWQTLVEFGEVKTVKKSEYLLSQGEVCHSGYFINTGCLVQTFVCQNGKQIVQGFFLDEVSAFVTSVSSYFAEEGTNFAIKAVENCEVIEFSKAQLEHLSIHFPEFSIFYYKITAEGFQKLYKFSALRCALSSEDFFRYLYIHHSMLMHRIPDKYVAQFMGVSKAWYSKLKKKITKQDLIQSRENECSQVELVQL